MEEITMEQEKLTFEELLRQDREYQSAFDRKVDKALQTHRAHWEAELAEEQEQMMEAARAHAEERYCSRHAALDRRERELNTTRRLMELGLPPQFAPWLTGESEEESLARLEAFEGAFRAGVEDSVARRLAGFAPVEPSSVPAYDRDTLRGMTPREINAHWAEIQHTLKGAM